MRRWRFRNRFLLIQVALLLIPLFGRDLPRSIVLIIADGAGVGQHSLAYYHNDHYAPASFQHVGLMATCPSDRERVTDSAAASTAIATGVKTYNGAIAVDDNQKPLKTVLEYARERGMATGLVATSVITQATPAAFAAHVDSRSKHAEIARQMAAAGITVLFGGGRVHFLAQDRGGEQEIDLLEAMSAHGVQIMAGLHEPLRGDHPVVGLFADGSLPAADKNRQPTTAAMALRALEILDNDPDGFFLMVEESQIDWGSSGNDADRVRAEMASLNDLIDRVLAYQTQHPEVLVVFVADHETGGLAIQDKAMASGLKAAWTTRGHTSNLVPIFATGPGGEAFDAVVDNTFIGQTLIKYVTSR
ncbi:MAG: alkaline phosphatase [Candidatus Neomarinimicrobiota bacterium]